LNAVFVVSMTAEERQSLRGLTILVVDDHRDTVDVLQEYLTLCGAQVIGAGGAKSALAILETHVLDAVLVDLYMPREDGWWLLRELRSSGTASANVPVYAVSGKRHDQLDPTSGFAGHFLKPVDLDRLVAALAALPRRLN
jgi:CheY-like chemotaxis protein